MFITVANYTAARPKIIDTDTSKAKQNGWYVELAGQSLLGLTFNYERYLSRAPGGFSVHIGAGGGYITDFFSDDALAFVAVPAGISYNLPLSTNNRHFFEMGVGYTFFIVSSDGGNIASIITSYRYQSRSGKFQLRATFMPATFLLNDGDTNNSHTISWVGLSIGRRF